MKKQVKDFNPEDFIHKISDKLPHTDELLTKAFDVKELNTSDVRSLICGGWFNHEAQIEVYVFHRCDFYEVRMSKYNEDGSHTRLGCYILLGINNSMDTHVCQFHDGEKDVLIGYNAYRDEIVLSPSGMEFVRTTIKSWDRFAERMRLASNDREDALDQEDQIFRKGYVSMGDEENPEGLSNLFKDILGHDGSFPKP